MPLTLVPELCAEHRRSRRSPDTGGTGSACRYGRADRPGFCGCWSLGCAGGRGLSACCAGTASSCCGCRAYARAAPGDVSRRAGARSALAYVPLALLFGPASWFQAGPFAFQFSRPLHYVLYFFAGAAIGACGIERGLFAPDGPLVRRWKAWLVAAVVLFFAWGGLTALAYPDPGPMSPTTPLALRALAGLSYVLACFASCFFVFAAAVRFAGVRSGGA